MRFVLCLLPSALLLLAACEAPTPPAWPEPGAWGPATGPGIATVAQDPATLFENCAYLDGGPEDDDHHNLVFGLDGYLVLPWAPEWSGGGISVFEFADPCAPVKVGETYAVGLREPHNAGLARHGDTTYGVFDWHGSIVDAELLGGIQFWDLSDPTAPAVVSDLALPGYVYPDSYARLSASVFWVGDRVWVSGADNGFWIVDASDPTSPEWLATVVPEPAMRVGAVHVVGDVAMVSSFEGARTVLYDVSNPDDPQPIPGGDFAPTDAEGTPREYYFANIGGGLALFARKDGGAGYIAVDITDPTAPTHHSRFHNPSGGGGYVVRHEQWVFEGEGDGGGAGVYDFSDPAEPFEVGRHWLTGDLDFVTPVGNVSVLSVDEDAQDDQATAVSPWRVEPDTRPPQLAWHRPVNGAEFVAATHPIGLSFDEQIDFASVFEGSVRVTDGAGWPVAGRFTAQEGVAHFTPLQPWVEDTVYDVVLPAGGIIDLSGNPLADEVRFRFSTGTLP